MRPAYAVNITPQAVIEVIKVVGKYVTYDKSQSYDVQLSELAETLRDDGLDKGTRYKIAQGIEDKTGLDVVKDAKNIYIVEHVTGGEGLPYLCENCGGNGLNPDREDMVQTGNTECPECHGAGTLYRDYIGIGSDLSSGLACAMQLSRWLDYLNATIDDWSSVEDQNSGGGSLYDGGNGDTQDDGGSGGNGSGSSGTIEGDVTVDGVEYKLFNTSDVPEGYYQRTRTYKGVGINVSYLNELSRNLNINDVDDAYLWIAQSDTGSYGRICVAAVGVEQNWGGTSSGGVDPYFRWTAWPGRGNVVNYGYRSMSYNPGVYTDDNGNKYALFNASISGLGYSSSVGVQDGVRPVYSYYFGSLDGNGSGSGDDGGGVTNNNFYNNTYDTDYTINNTWPTTNNTTYNNTTHNYDVTNTTNSYNYDQSTNQVTSFDLDLSPVTMRLDALNQMVGQIGTDIDSIGIDIAQIGLDVRTLGNWLYESFFLHLAMMDDMLARMDREYYRLGEIWDAILGLDIGGSGADVSVDMSGVEDVLSDILDEMSELDRSTADLVDLSNIEDGIADVYGDTTDIGNAIGSWWSAQEDWWDGLTEQLYGIGDTLDDTLSDLDSILSLMRSDRYVRRPYVRPTGPSGDFVILSDDLGIDALRDAITELMTKFPFSTINNLALILTALTRPAVTPVFDLPVLNPVTPNEPYLVHVDLSAWDTVASIGRVGILLWVISKVSRSTVKLWTRED